ncbi:TrbI/VirB10 family protein [Dyella dinghuensis]|uniref:TrbI/VirB10 family protein n=2 Tax=Dyella dinghuensis TaxID=1920169 RepID=A0A432LZ12_9GAMM|nr:TrbI/VirB10 family protein [Dyella dinghuensis]
MGGGNPYSTRYHETAAPDLDANAPQLRSADMQRMNRKALFLLGATVLLVIVVAIWLINSVENRKGNTVKQRDEMVTVPEAPKAAPPPMRETSLKQTVAIPLAQSSVRTIDSRTLIPTPPPPSAPVGPSLRERRMMSADPEGENGSGNQANAALPTQLQAGVSEDTSAQPLNNPDTLMLRGTYIRCVLETRIITDIPGFTSCVVTEPVYSFNGRKLLLPKGSKVLGKYEGEPNGPRVAVIWDRIVTPTGIDVNMASPGVDNLGGAGHPGYYNAHWGSRIGAALLISMLSDAFKYEAAEHGPTQTTISNGVVTQTPFESNTAQTVQNLANQAVQRAANKPPTVTINQGTVVTIYVAKDVDFSGVVARF